ncbi:MAG: hypothetical protein JRD89_10450 [Deltaproteobacteria bacterium]|nr:hypothetical protein [Deltaproteobacteria bacterium]
MTSYTIRVGGRESPGSMDDMPDMSLLDLIDPSKSLLVHEKTTLRAIIADVERDFGLSDPDLMSVTLVFGHELHEFYGRMFPDMHGDHLTVADDSGALRWWVPQGEWDTVTFANLIESHAAGLIGDPTEIRVHKTGQWGNGIPPMNWPQFFEVLEHILTVLGLGTFAVRGFKVLKTRYENWRDVSARPEDIVRFVVDRASWDRVELAKRLAIPRDDAKVLLDLFGYTYDPQTQLYVRNEDGRTARVRNEIKDAFEKYEG